MIADFKYSSMECLYRKEIGRCPFRAFAEASSEVSRASAAFLKASAIAPKPRSKCLSSGINIYNIAAYLIGRDSSPSGALRRQCSLGRYHDVFMQRGHGTSAGRTRENAIDRIPMRSYMQSAAVVNSFSRCPFYYLTLPKLEITSVG